MIGLTDNKVGIWGTTINDTATSQIVNGDHTIHLIVNIGPKVVEDFTVTYYLHDTW